MTAQIRPTLRQVFYFSLLALFLVLALLLYFVLKGSEQTILQRSDRYRDPAGATRPGLKRALASTAALPWSGILARRIG
jgi:hypothetical protein